MTEAEQDELVGRTLASKYRVVRKLGSGGMGAVWEAVQEGLGRPVAIKTVHAHLANDKTLVARFRREAESVARIGHPHIVQVFDFHEASGDDPPFLVMELLSGEPLAALVKRSGPIAADRAARIGVQALAALEAAHRAGIVHRDVKPDNVFLVTGAKVEDFVKVLDFGVAKLLGEGVEQKLTATGLVVGTLAYMAPEQATGGVVDGRADQHALAACLYFATSGKRPYLKSSTREMLLALATEEAPPLASQAPTVDPGFAAIVERALRREPGDRWESCAAMGDALEAWLVTWSGVATAPMASPATVSAPTQREVPPPADTPPPGSLASPGVAAATAAHGGPRTLEIPAAPARTPSSPPRPHTLVSAGVAPPERATVPSPEPGRAGAPAFVADSVAIAPRPATPIAPASAGEATSVPAALPTEAAPAPPEKAPVPTSSAPVAVSAPTRARPPRPMRWGLVLSASAGAVVLLGGAAMVGLYFLARSTAESLSTRAPDGAATAPAPSAPAAAEPDTEVAARGAARPQPQGATRPAPTAGKVAAASAPFASPAGTSPSAATTTALPGAAATPTPAHAPPGKEKGKGKPK
jgi:serine/threonine-protein kinase